MKNVREYEARQLKLMREVLISFEKHHLPLIDLVGQLYSLINALESINEDYGNDFFEYVGELDTINAIEIIKEGGDYSIQPIEGEEKERIINNSILRIKKIIKSKLKQLIIRLDKTGVKNLSFPNFDVKKMKFSLEKKMLKIFMKSALLKENEEKILGNGILFFNNWESLEINKFNPVTETWISVKTSYPEYLKYLFEIKFFNSSICLCGFGEENQLEWKIKKTQMHAEFNPDSELMD